MARKIRQRKNHSRLNQRLIGNKQKFAKRAMSRGIRNTKQLSDFTGIQREKLCAIEDEVKFAHRASGKPLPENTVERLLISGELSISEIIKLTGYSRQAVDKAEARLDKRGFEVKIYPKSRTPPMKLARGAVIFRVYKEVEGLSHTNSALRAGAFEGIPSAIIKLSKKPGFFERVKSIGNGSYWRRALKQLEPWIREAEINNGKKFKA